MNALAALFDDRRGNHGAKIFSDLRAVGGGADDCAINRIQNDGDENGDECAPEKYRR